MNAGDLGSSLAVCACAYDPTHVTAQGPSLSSTAHALFEIIPKSYHKGKRTTSTANIKDKSSLLGYKTLPLADVTSYACVVGNSHKSSTTCMSVQDPTQI